jgi:hypothetical protein
VLAFRANDGSNQAGGYADTIGYQPVNTPDQVNDPFRWQPLRHPDANGNLVVQKYLTPHWGNVSPFALTSANQFLPPGPTQRTLLQLDEEVTDTLAMSATLTDLTKTRAEYWADGPDSETPPGRWLLFAGAVCRARGYRVTVRRGTSFVEPGATPLLPTILTWPTFSRLATRPACRGATAASTSPTPTSTAERSAPRSASRPGTRPSSSSTARRAAKPPSRPPGGCRAVR